MKRRLLTTALLGLALVAAGCGDSTDTTDSAASSAAPGFPVTIENCGVTTTYQAPPKRAVTLNQHATEVMLALGLEKSMVGTAYLDDKISPKYQAAYAKIPVLAKEYPSFEDLIATDLDFAYAGYSRSAFAEKDGRSRDALKAAGVDTYANIEQCPGTQGDGSTLATVDTEVGNIAKIFGVTDRAEKLTAQFHATLDDVTTKLSGVAPVKVLVDGGGDSAILTSGRNGIGHDMITRAGGTNVFADLDDVWGDVSYEQAAQRGADVIVLVDYGDLTIDERRAKLRANPALADLAAIKNNRIFVLSLSSMTVGVRAPDATAALAAQLHPDVFGK